jgi:subtilase family serine protease
MSKSSELLSDQPINVSTAINTALIATVNLLALVFSWDATLVAALNLTLGAWVIAFSAIYTGRRVVAIKPLEEYAAAVAASTAPEFP